MRKLEGVDWEGIYTPHLSKIKKKEAKLTSLCPFHEESNPSFSVDLTEGLYHCFACGAKGNGIQFISQRTGVTPKEAYTKLLKEMEYMPSSDTLEAYGREKYLPVGFLKNSYVTQTNTCLSMAYYNVDKSWTRNRLRFPASSKIRFRWGKGEGMQPYGLWKLEKIRGAGYVILVEGESDTQTLWYSGLPALGIPGASSFKAEWCTYFEGLKTVYLYQEPDKGGETFVNQVKLRLKKQLPELEVYVIADTGFKDVSEYFIQSQGDKRKTKSWVQACMIQAKDRASIQGMVTIDLLKEVGCEALQIPEGYSFAEEGIWKLGGDEGNDVLVCRNPIIITSKIKSIDTEEKKLELAFKVDGKWNKIHCKPSQVFNHISILMLADCGVSVCSTSSKYLVNYLYEFENTNMDKLPIRKSVERLGWHGGQFFPYGAEDLELDTSCQGGMWGHAYHTKGDYDTWVAFVNSMRTQSPIIRAYIAAACGTPFQQALGQRIFYLYNWAESEGGKSACLNLAMSVWGDPKELVQTYNSTSVGLEYMASYMNDLPLALNERQSAGKDQSKLETDAYRLAEGKGRIRGNKHGGIQSRGDWRTILLCNGEEPFITEKTMSGVATRTLEIEGKPYERDKDARATYELIKDHYGLLGEAIVQKIIHPDKLQIITQQIKKIKKVIEEALLKEYPQYRSSNITAISFITAIDIWLTIQFFEPTCTQNDAINKGFEMAKYILLKQPSKDEGDIIEKMYSRTCDWLAINHNKFIIRDRLLQDPQGEIYGIIEHSGTIPTYYVYPKVFEDFCNQQNQNYTQILKGYADKKYIQCTYDKYSRRTTIGKRIRGSVCRLIAIPFQQESIA